MEKIKITNKRGKASWGSIFGGVVTVLAVSILLSILAMSIGFFQIDPSTHGSSHIGATAIIFTVISLLLSFAAGGFVAGKLSCGDGMIHGFLVWAATTFITVILVGWLAMGAMRMAGNVLGSVANVTANVVSGAGSVIESGVSGLAHEAQNLFGDIDFNGDLNRTEVRREVRQALRKSGVKEFQPEYLDKQMKAVKTDFDKSVRKLVVNPNDAEDIINKFLDRLSTRTENAFKDVDRNDLTRAIANNTNYSQAEVNKAVDEYIELYNDAVAQGRESVENLQQAVENARQEWEVVKQNARIEVDKATNAAGRAALWSFFALLVGAAVSVGAAHFGSKATKDGYEI